MTTAFRFYSILRELIYRITHWESWPWLVKYVPIIPIWIWYCFRCRSVWFFSASNPTLTFGGFEGEPKKEMYDQLPDHTYPLTFLISYPTPFARIRKLIREEFSFPVAVKPDVGRMGLMFRKINSIEELYQYHQQMTANYILQEFIQYPMEVSLFYYRYPGEANGTITGFIKKEYLSVKGDGHSTLWELMLAYTRVRFRLNEMKVKHADQLHSIIPAGEYFILCHALNLSRGGQLISLEAEKDESLLRVFDQLSHFRGNFYYGRYDIKCSSVQDLKQGRNFSILEFNGGGAEPHHVYGNGNSLIRALIILVQHWNVLCRISRANHKKGTPYWDLKRGYNHLLKSREHFRMLRHLDATTMLRAQIPAENNIHYQLPSVRSGPALAGAFANSTFNRNADER